MQVHKESKSLVLRVRDPLRITSHIPRARVVQYEGMDLTQVHFGLDEARVLRNLGWNVPSPIRYFYSFPIKPPFKPFDHQVTTAEFLTLNSRSICLNDMGTGKTLSALWASDYLMHHGYISKMIIVCPKSTMTVVWEDEVATHFFGHRKVAVLSGTKERRLKQLARTDVDFYVINHDGLKVIEKELRKRTDINGWIIDEADAFRTATSQRHKLLAGLVRPTDWLWLLTGTPCPHSPTDAWGLARLMYGNRVQPQFFTDFRLQTMFQISEYKWLPKPDAMARAYEILKPGIRFTKAQCISLPPVTFQTRMCSLGPDQAAAYKAMVNHMVAEVKGVEITAANAAVKMLKLLQVCVGSIYDEYGNGYDLAATDRLAVCEEICEHAAQKVIVFVPFTQALNTVANHLRQRWTVEVVDGSVSDTKRAEIFRAFQNEDNPRILVAHPDTASHGLTLTKADTTIWYAPITKMGVFEQANNRMNRPGQTEKMTVVMLAATALEQNLYQALKTKQDMQGALLGMFKSELQID